jgi:hypothetical protein
MHSSNRTAALRWAGLAFSLIFSLAAAAAETATSTSSVAPVSRTAVTSAASSGTSTAAPRNDVPLHQETAFYGATLKHGIPISGTAKRVIRRLADGTWEYRFDVDSFLADIHEWVIFHYNDSRIVPIRYHYQLTGWAVPDRNARLDFNWQTMHVRNDVKNKPWLMKIHPGVLDRLGSQLQLRQDIKAGRRDLFYYVADGGELKDYRFAVVGPETLKTRKVGTVQTLKVREIRDPGAKRKTDLWFAPGWDYLLVKLVQIEPDGTRYEIFLDHAQIPGRRIGDWSKEDKTDASLMPGRH